MSWAWRHGASCPAMKAAEAGRKRQVGGWRRTQGPWLYQGRDARYTWDACLYHGRDAPYTRDACL